MTAPLPVVFAFEEADHLTRIHVKLALEDVGFAVQEEDATIRIGAPPADVSIALNAPAFSALPLPTALSALPLPTASSRR